MLLCVLLDWEVIQSAGGGKDNPTCTLTNQLFVPSSDECSELFRSGIIDLNVCFRPADRLAWIGKTYFFMRGAGEVDLNIEAKEIRENLTDFD